MGSSQSGLSLRPRRDATMRHLVTMCRLQTSSAGRRCPGCHRPEPIPTTIAEVAEAEEHVVESLAM